MSDIQSDVMRPIDPLLLVEDGYQRGAYEVGLGSFDLDMLDDFGDNVLGGFNGIDIDMWQDMGSVTTLGASPTDPLFPSDVFTPTQNIFGPGTGHQASTRLGGFSDAMDVLSVARFIFEGR